MIILMSFFFFFFSEISTVEQSAFPHCQLVAGHSQVISKALGPKWGWFDAVHERTLT